MIVEYQKAMTQLLGSSRYISRKEYLPLKEKYKEVIDFFEVLVESKTLEYFCKENQIETSKILDTLRLDKELVLEMEHHNDEFIAQNLYFPI
ncbi:hypothetical protein P261_02771 [Lachnospiraceae bacterium TWA4]|nr:hypothetical protein P261_02771 [Lachnospiraceae bacterium TWA4]